MLTQHSRPNARRSSGPEHGRSGVLARAVILAQAVFLPDAKYRWMGRAYGRPRHHDRDRSRARFG